MLHRKAARVFPDPVGAWIRVWSPAPIDSHPRSWAGVGSVNTASNHDVVGDENRSRLRIPISVPIDRDRIRVGHPPTTLEFRLRVLTMAQPQWFQADVSTPARGGRE
jgi:hypothetical protein